MAPAKMIVPERRQFSLAGAAEASESSLNSQDRAASVHSVHDIRPAVASLLDNNQRDAVDQTIGQQEVAVARDGSVADDISTARDCPALEFFGFGVETHDGVRVRSGLAVPYHVIDRGDAIRLGFRPARRLPLPCAASRGI